MSADAVGLLVAKAPVPGFAKTRLAAHVGDHGAAELAAAGLLDTLDALSAAFPVVHVSLAGDLDDAVQAEAITQALTRCEVSRQEGDGLGERLAHAHRCAGGADRLVVQVGMDTPQVSPDLLGEVQSLAGDRRTAVLGPAMDGGWWVLALRDPDLASVLASVPMSRDDTADQTERALQRAGAQVRRAPALRDVDEVVDAQVVAQEAPGSRFAAIWARLGAEPGTRSSGREQGAVSGG